MKVTEQSFVENCTVNFVPCYDDVSQYIGYMLFLMPISLVGVIVNCLTFAVLLQRQFRTTMAIFTLMRGLAVADIFACLFVFPVGFFRYFPTTLKDGYSLTNYRVFEEQFVLWTPYML